MAAIDTNVLLRLLLRDDPKQLARAQQLVRDALDRGELLFVPVTVALELEWVLRSRYALDKTAVLAVFAQLLTALDLNFEAPQALEAALRQYKGTATDFSDCLHATLAWHAGEAPLWTFDKAAAKLAGVELLEP